MKKSFLLLLLFLTIGLTEDLRAQTTSKIIYCEIYSMDRSFSDKIKVRVDYGTEDRFMELQDDLTRKSLIFNSMIDALNYMAKLGWELVQVYKESEKTHYILRKEIN